MNRLSSTLGLVAVGALVAACGGLAGDTKSYPALATLKGQLSNPDSIQTVTAATPTGDIRVAVVWVAQDADSYNVPVDISVKAVFDSEFQVALTAPPPDSTIATNKNVKDSSNTVSTPPTASGGTTGSDTSGSSGSGSAGSGPGARSAGNAASHIGSGASNVHIQNFAQQNWPDGFGIAIGAVVAYQDLNGNGKLDLIDRNATKYVDRILGANEDLLLVYVQGEVPAVTDFMDDSGKLPQQGYNLFRVQTCSGVLGTVDNGASCHQSLTWLSLDTTLYDLPLSGDPKFSQLMCQGQSGFDSSGSSSDVGVSSGGGSGGTTTTPTPVETDGGSASTDAGVSDGGSDDASASDGGPAPDSGAVDAGPVVGPADPSYPSPSDPNLVCINNGHEFYLQCSPQPQPIPDPTPTGLCNQSAFTSTPTAGCASEIFDLPTPTPSNWPCPIQ